MTRGRRHAGNGDTLARCWEERDLGALLAQRFGMFAMEELADIDLVIGCIGFASLRRAVSGDTRLVIPELAGQGRGRRWRGANAVRQ